MERSNSLIPIDHFIIQRGMFLGVVPSEIDGKSALLQYLATAFCYPGYFGANWDALYDLLTDLSWIVEKRACLVHIDVPKIEPSELVVYSEILNDVGNSWKPTDRSFSSYILQST